MLILISDAFDPSLEGKLAEFGEVTTDKSRQHEADVVLIRSKTTCDKEYIENAPNLKLILRGGVGTDNIDKVCCAEKGIVVHNTPNAPSIAVAELAFAMMLAIPNHIVKANESMRMGQWLKKELKRTELHGKTLGLVGIGHIAQAVAERAKAFGMHVIAYDKYVDSSRLAVMKNSLEEMVAEADYISLHVPLTDETMHMINKDLIAKMKDGVIIINTGRGRTINSEDVIEALNSGKIAAYATDVWPKDPPPADYPLLKAPNVFMSPHLGASSNENLLRIGDEICDRIRDFIGGKK
jgi:D-3-phosphoglycerate dehydrogenase|nr:hydroxyacid dehydrogenase [Candidatus Krumholzibacteria bacterium]